MKKIFYFLLLLSFTASGQVGEIYKRLSRIDTIYILATGQSNMSGRNYGNYDTASNSRVQAWNGSAWVTARRGVAPMGWKTPGAFISADEGGDAKYDTATGSWFYLAKRLQEKTGKVVRVVSVPYGGNSIDTWVASGEASTAFATIKTYSTNAAINHYHFFLWDQGETDSGMSDTAYKRRMDSLTVQLDRQSWFGKDVSMFITSVPDSNHLADFRQINCILMSLGQGAFDKRWTWVDSRLEPTVAETFSTQDGIHYTAQSQYNIANKIMQLVYNRPAINNAYLLTNSTQRTNIAAFSPRVFRGATQDSTTGTVYHYTGSAFVSASSVWTTTGSDIYNNNAGKVGIGGAPSYNFDVTGDARITGVLSINTTPQASQRLAIVSGGATSSSYGLVVNNSTPAALLTVRSDKLTEISGNLNINANAAPTNRALSITPGSNTYSFVVEKSSGFAILVTGSAGDITFGNGAMTFGAGAITSAALATGLSNETGTGLVMYNNSPLILHAYVAKATSYSVATTDECIEVTATGQTMTLPTAVGVSGKQYTIKLTASGSSTVATTSSQTIDGSTTYSLSAQYKYVTVQSNGSNWIVIANN